MNSPIRRAVGKVELRSPPLSARLAAVLAMGVAIGFAATGCGDSDTRSPTVVGSTDDSADHTGTRDTAGAPSADANRLDGGSIADGSTTDDSSSVGPGSPDAGGGSDGPDGTSSGGVEWSSSADWKSVEAGFLHTCGLKNSGRVSCWGLGSKPNAVEDQEPISRDFDQATPPDSTFDELAVGYYHACALDSSGAAECWGLGTDPNETEGPQSGGFDYDQAVPPKNDDIPYATATQLAAGAFNTCIVGSEPHYQTYCWGRGLSHVERRLPQLSPGAYHTCGLTDAGEAVCWGEGSYGEDGELAYGQADPPAQRFRQISAGGRHTCGIDRSGSVHCWGLGSAPDLDEAKDIRDEPGDWNQASPPAGSFEIVSAGPFHTCGITTDGELECWGLGSDPSTGETDSRGFVDRDQARPPDGAFNDVTAGGFHSCAVARDGRIACWGLDRYGQASPP